MNKDISPEERLLHLIKGKKEEASSQEKEKVEATPPIESDQQQKTIADEPQPPLPPEQELKSPQKEKDLPRQKEEVVDEPKAEKPSGGLSFSFGTKHIYIVASLIFVAIFGYFTFNIFSNKEDQEMKDLQRLISSISEDAMAPEPKEVVKETQQPAKQKDPEKSISSFDDYQKMLNEKTIFAPPASRKSKKDVSEGPGLRELVKDLTLVGIMPGDEPQAIIEDKKSGQTLFLIKGESIDNIEIKDIASGRVVLGYGEDTITLSL